MCQSVSAHVMGAGLNHRVYVQNRPNCDWFVTKRRLRLVADSSYCVNKR
jgi:TFIIF-interacting CTD phosphatase-like protein